MHQTYLFKVYGHIQVIFCECYIYSAVVCVFKLEIDLTSSVFFDNMYKAEKWVTTKYNVVQAGNVHRTETEMLKPMHAKGWVLSVSLIPI